MVKKQKVQKLNINEPVLRKWKKGFINLVYFGWFVLLLAGRPVWTALILTDHRDWDIVYRISWTIARGALLCALGFALRLYRLPCSLSLYSLKPTLLIILTSPFLPFTLRSCPPICPRLLCSLGHFEGLLVLIVVVDQSSCSAVCPLVTWPHTTAEGMSGWQLPLVKQKQTDGQSGWWDRREGFRAPSVSCSPGRQLDSLNPAGFWGSAAIRTESLAWNMTNVFRVWPGERPSTKTQFM